MPALRTNILANYAGQAWMAAMSVVFVPLYIRLLGMESFGLIGLMLSMQALSMLFDLGMGSMLNRELARRAHHAENPHAVRDLVRTLEWLVWPIAVCLALAIWLASGPVARHWLHPSALTQEETAHAVAIMGLAVAMQWPSSFYSSGLSGLERQPMLNAINAAFATMRGAGVLAVLYWISPTITAFMAWYAAMGACQSLVSAWALWHLLPMGADRRAKFNAAELRGTVHFAGGLIAITALSIAVTQLDRIVLSAMRPLEELGYFSLALSVAAGLGRMIQPMFNALYPRYSRLVAHEETNTLGTLYHLSNQCVAVVIAAISAVLFLFSKDVVYLWSGDASISAKVATPLSILIAGTALNGLMTLPYALQLAYGWTRLTIGTNLVALLLGIPFCLWAVDHYGIVGAACMWLATNLGFVAVAIPLMHRRLMLGGMRRWYLQDVLPPFLAGAAAGLVARCAVPALTRDAKGFLLLAVVSGCVLAASAIASPYLRQQAWQACTRLKLHLP